MKPGRDQKRALQWLSKGALVRHGSESKSFETEGGSVSEKVMRGLEERDWAVVEERPPYFGCIQKTWWARITDAGRKALEDAP